MDPNALIFVDIHNADTIQYGVISRQRLADGNVPERIIIGRILRLALLELDNVDGVIDVPAEGRIIIHLQNGGLSNVGSTLKLERTRQNIDNG